MAKKLSDKERMKIVADYVDNQNYSETARMNNVDTETVRRIVKADKDFARKSEEKKLENIQSTIEYMQTQHDTKKRILDKLLKAIETKSENVDMFTNIRDLATAYGILVDKELKVLELKTKTANEEEELQKVKDLLVTIKEVADNDKWYRNKQETSWIY